MSERSTARNYGIDALRIVSMLMIVTLHVNGQGGIMWTVDPHSLRWCIVWFGEIAAMCSVDCYAMISGYVGGSTSRHYTNLAVLWLQVAFYTVGITALFAVLRPGMVTAENWRSALLPVTTGQYWYFTAYAVMSLFAPALDAALAHLPKRQLQALVLVLLVLGSLLPTLCSVDPVGVKGGCNAQWLMILYLLGGYAAKYHPLQNIHSYWLAAGFFAATGLTWLGWFLFRYTAATDFFGFSGMISNTAPLMVLAAFFLLSLFARLSVRGKLRTVVRFFSPLSFSVYLIHTNPLVWDNFMTNRFQRYTSLGGALMLAHIVGTVLAIYLVCALIDLVRARLFTALGVKRCLAALESKLIQ